MLSTARNLVVGILSVVEQCLFREPVLARGERWNRGQERFVLWRSGKGFHRHVLHVIGEQIYPRGEFRELPGVAELPQDDIADLAAGGIRALVQEHEFETQPITGEGQHAAKLAGAYDTDGLCRYGFG